MPFLKVKRRAYTKCVCYSDVPLHIHTSKSGYKNPYSQQRLCWPTGTTWRCGDDVKFREIFYTREDTLSVLHFAQSHGSLPTRVFLPSGDYTVCTDVRTKWVTTVVSRYISVLFWGGGTCLHLPDYSVTLPMHVSKDFTENDTLQ